MGSRNSGCPHSYAAPVCVKFCFSLLAKTDAVLHLTKQGAELCLAAGLGLGPRISRPERDVLPVAPPRKILYFKIFFYNYQAGNYPHAYAEN